MLLRELASSANEEAFVVYDEQDSFLEPTFYIPFGKNTVEQRDACKTWFPNQDCT